MAAKRSVRDDDEEDQEDSEEEASEKPAKKKAAKKATTPRKPRSKAAATPRTKLYWGVFNQNLKRVAVFEYEKKKDAEKHAKELTKAGSEHFLQKIKEAIE